MISLKYDPLNSIYAASLGQQAQLPPPAPHVVAISIWSTYDEIAAEFLRQTYQIFWQLSFNKI